MNRYKLKRYYADILVIGGGGAALRAAIEACRTDSNLKVILVTKGELGKSGVTATACSDRMAFQATLLYTEPGGKDNWKYHAEDIYRIGGEVSDYDLAEILARKSSQAFAYLDALGVPFVKKDGKAAQFLSDGSEYPRACYTGPHTANEIEKALVGRIKTLDVRILENQMIVELLTSEDGRRVIGAFAIDDRAEADDTHSFSLFMAGTIILATGGAGQAYEVNAFPKGMTGDGYSLAYRAGAELVNMEFIQMGLCSLKTKLACSGSLMRSIPRIINSDDQEFLKNYFPKGTGINQIYNIVFAKGSSWPVSCRDVSRLIDIAVFKELSRGRKVYLDYSRNPEGLDFHALDERIKEWYIETKGINLTQEEVKKNPLARLEKINSPSITWLREHGIHLQKGERIEIAPAVQHFQGGIKIRRKGETTLKGLYACGECAGGEHGANRPGGNALLDSQVFGKISGRNAAIEAAGLPSPAIPEKRIESYLKRMTSVFNKREGMPASLVRKKVQRILSGYAGVMRIREELSEGIDKLKEVKKKECRIDENGLIYYLETKNIIDVAAIILNACRIRNESRGPHLRFNTFRETEPLPRDDDNWRRYIVLKKDVDSHELGFEIREPVRPCKEEGSNGEKGNIGKDD